jgi:hypothetical protein
VSGLTFGDTQLCWRCRGSGKTGRGVCAVCGGGGILGVGEKPPEATQEQRRAEGRAERDRILPAVAASEPKWSDKAMAWIESRLPLTEFTADDLTLTIGYPEKRAAVGSVFSQASRRKLVERAGLEQSATPSSHASVIQVWRRI